jgi:hypothetical protein
MAAAFSGSYLAANGIQRILVTSHDRRHEAVKDDAITTTIGSLGTFTG